MTRPGIHRLWRGVCIAIALIVVQPVEAATITVNTAEVLASADDGFCTLTEAVLAANSNTASGALPGECVAGEAVPVQDLIVFEPSLFPAHFQIFSTLHLNESIKIQGPGAAVMDVTNLAETRVFNILNLQANSEFEISGMTLRDNVLRAVTGDYGGAALVSLGPGSSLLFENIVFLNNSSERGGGALGFFGGGGHSITIRNCTFDGNRAGNFGDGNVVGGGAVFIGAQQTISIENSSFINNETFHDALAQPQEDAAGGAILLRSGQTLASVVDIFQSTFSGNSTTGVGGAIALGGPGFPAEISELSLRHSTVVFNISDSNDDEVAVAGGGGVWSASSAPVQLFNSIVALNADNADSPAPDLHGSMQSFGFNLVSMNATVSGVFPAGQPNGNDDWVGTAPSPLDPLLEALDYAGGPTPVHVPMLGSPVLDQGRCTSRLTDQRLFQNTQTGLRVIDIGNIIDAADGCDIGAVELFSASSNPIPVANDDIYTAFEDQPLTVAAINGLLQNDLDDDALIVIDASPADQNRGLVAAQLTASADGAFVFETLSPDTSGQTEFVYVISDNLNTGSASVFIDVLPVNDAPSFAFSTDSLAAVPAQPTLIEDWATEIGAGPADEQGQSVQFLVSPVDVPVGFFSVSPSLQFGGTGNADLSFEIAAGATGSAIVSIVLLDNGGTANGGVNLSDAVVVNISASTDSIFHSRFEGIDRAGM
ncbi:choice-of-anchor Q domain-containing protein [Wenzhouxiangella marina]|uniref:choice-of-anchor Q domain-containing protein n=1 Tax=Wenzhouxiangella marina TaxID=1579979 RepID=UPI0006735EB4|nr:choice-of-anchor Q domain-containing protein [Wenzhouxiangella marina]MBB6086981.1 hypothetical protein [Wenzhouxiangella marina]